MRNEYFEMEFDDEPPKPIVIATLMEHFQHDVCPCCGTKSVPAEKVPDQALRGCPKCEHVWYEDLDWAPTTIAGTARPA
jgi:NADH pyrophosphatase NudC (nudix superfamily)